MEYAVDEQDQALRRVLKLLVDWVENDDRGAGTGEAGGLRGAA